MTGYRRGLRRTHSGLAPKTVETLIWRFMHKIFYFLRESFKKVSRNINYILRGKIPIYFRLL